VLRALPQVSTAVVAVGGTGTGTEATCTAYLVLRPGATAPELRVLRQELRRRLPAAAVPDGFAVLDRLPLTGTGKIDHRALAAHARPLRPTGGAEAPPRTLVERELAALWQIQLGDRRISRTDDFFDVGGHSLRALLLIASTRKRMGVELTMTELFDHPTLAEQAALIEERLVEAVTSGAAR
jgi:aryl carrier-like protein